MVDADQDCCDNINNVQIYDNGCFIFVKFDTTLSGSPEILIFNFPRQCSNVLKGRWEILHGFHLKFIRLSAVKEF